MNVIGYELHVLKDNATGEFFDNAVWFSCPVCKQDSLARFHGEVDLKKTLRARCCKTEHLVTVSKKLKQ
ncbi:hypothetical protein [Pseudoalteromonas galatheae]|uniref:hypothetical protein n=1 Tax=Pseudoalteromonas galatheae TaxID=579562 RepID=UPI0030D07BD7